MTDEQEPETPELKMADAVAARVERERRTKICTCDKPQLRCPAHDAEFTEEELLMERKNANG